MTTDRDGQTINLPPLPNMTLGQELRLRRLCSAYGVDFNPAHYTRQFDLPSGWVAGWIGGGRLIDGPATIYVGVSPEGESSS